MLEKIILKNTLDASRIFNLEEAGTTTEKDQTLIAAPRRLMPRRGERDVKTRQFTALNRVTMMAIISAASEAAPPFLFLNGLEFRSVLCSEPARWLTKRRSAISRTGIQWPTTGEWRCKLAEFSQLGEQVC